MPKGGARPGAGRPKGRKDNATLAREAALAAAVERIKQGRSEAEFVELSMLEIIETAARGLMAAGDLKGAAQIAALALPYQLPRKMAEAREAAFPPDLMPDPEPCPDEPGPENPIH